MFLEKVRQIIHIRSARGRRSSGGWFLRLFILLFIVPSAGCTMPFGGSPVSVFDESPQKALSIKVVDHTMTVSERDKHSIIKPAVTETLVPKLKGNKIVRVEVNRLEQSDTFTNYMTCLTLTPLLGAPYKYVTYTADVSLFVSIPSGLTVGPYRAKKKAKEYGGLFKKVDPKRGMATALRKAVNSAAYRAARDRRKIIASLGGGLAALKALARNIRPQT